MSEHIKHDLEPLNMDGEAMNVFDLLKVTAELKSNGVTNLNNINALDEQSFYLVTRLNTSLRLIVNNSLKVDFKSNEGYDNFNFLYGRDLHNS